MRRFFFNNTKRGTNRNTPRKSLPHRRLDSTNLAWTSLGSNLSHLEEKSGDCRSEPWGGMGSSEMYNLGRQFGGF